MDEYHTLSAVAKQFTLACDLCTLVYLTTLSNGGAGRYYPLILLAYAPALYGLDRLFLRRSRTMRGLLILNAVMGAGLFFSVCLADGWENLGNLIFIGVFCMWPTVQAGKLVLEPPELHSMILCLDASAVILVLFIGFLTATGLPIYWSAPIAAGCAAAILGVISRRINRSMGPRDWGMVLLSFGGIFAGMLLLVSFVAAPAGQGVMALWHGLVALVQFLLKIFLQILIFLSSLFEPPEGGELPLDQPIQLPGGERMMEEENPLLMAIMVSIALVMVLFLLVYVLYRLGKLRIGGKQGKKKAAKKERRQRPSFWRAIRRLLATLGARLRLRAFLWRERNTPRGLFCLLVYRCRMGSWRKQPGETPREFLTRLRESAQGDQELSAALDGLIPVVDRALYAQEPENCGVPKARLIRRRISAAVHRQSLRNCWTKVRTLCGRREGA